MSRFKLVPKNLIARGFDVNALKVVSSDGSLGTPKAISNHFPQAQQQRCITHKVRGIERHLNYANLPTVNDQGQPWKPIEAKKQRHF